MLIILISFDDCSLIHLCNIIVSPFAIKILKLSNNKFEFRNHDSLNVLLDTMKSSKITPYRFVPSNIGRNLNKAIIDLYVDKGLPNPVANFMIKADIANSIIHHMSILSSDFININKTNDFQDVKSNFMANQKPLTKTQKNPTYKDVPEDDDCNIIKSLFDYISDEEKFIVSEDEHFWGYKQLIQDSYGIIVYKEELCLSLPLF